MTIRKASILVSLFLLCVVALLTFLSTSHSTKDTLNVAVSLKWGDTFPPRLSSLLASRISTFQFESLVTIGRYGNPEPGLASNWSSSSDFKTLSFSIDNSRRFSNGKPLTAQDIKFAWEHGYRVQKDAGKHRTLDFFSHVEGFSEFDKNNGFSGIVATDDTHLVVRFSTGYRMALETLTAAQHAIFLLDHGTPIGTGPYVPTLERESENQLFMRNSHFPEPLEFEKVNLIVIDDQVHSISALREGRIDILMAPIESTDAIQPPVEQLIGWEGSHAIAALNGTQGTIFSDGDNRRTLQWIMSKEIGSHSSAVHRVEPSFKFDPQVFLQFQAGRYSDSKVLSTIEDGHRDLSKLRKQATIHPIRVIALNNAFFAAFADVFVAIMSAYGVEVESGQVKLVDLRTLVNSYGDVLAADVILTQKGLINGDPANLYHWLTAAGIVSSKITHRERVSQLLTDGIKITSSTDIAPHYERVNEAILDEVPFIHFGFRMESLLINSDNVYSKNIFHRRIWDLMNFGKRS